MNLLSRSREVILSHQNQSGAFVASPSFPHYQYSWLRDGSFIAFSLDCIGEKEPSERFHRWAAGTIERYSQKALRVIELAKQGKEIPLSLLLHTRYNVNGEEVEGDWGTFQLDGYGTWLWGFAEHVKRWNNTALVKEMQHTLELVVEYLLPIWQMPNFDCWEEFGESIHPSTIGAIYGGIQAISPYVNEELAYRAGKELSLMKTFLLREGTKHGHFSKSVGSDEVDASLLWLHIPFRVIDGDDPIMERTLKLIEERLLVQGGLHRYPQDVYYGGGQWILLSASLGWFYAERQQLEKANALLQWVECQFDEFGNLPEQVGHHLLDHDQYNEWLRKWGKSACPLLWSHAMHIILRTQVELLQKMD